MTRGLFTDRAELEEIFRELAAESFRRAYPHGPDDEHLVRFIADVAIDADTE